MPRRKAINALAIVSLVLLPFTLTVACSDAAPVVPNELKEVPAALDAEPGDPAVYAPPGWPLKVGDLVTREFRTQVEDQFVSPHYSALHVVGDRTYAARWDLPDDPDDDRLVYAGHFPFSLHWLREQDEHLLPERFHGKITYDPRPEYWSRLPPPEPVPAPC